VGVQGVVGVLGVQGVVGVLGVVQEVVVELEHVLVLEDVDEHVLVLEDEDELHFLHLYKPPAYFISTAPSLPRPSRFNIF
jgi:hypothetical protein